jgi:hypothetical protein
MKKSRLTEEQIIGIVKQHEAGMKTADLCREMTLIDSIYFTHARVEDMPILIQCRAEQMSR